MKTKVLILIILLFSKTAFSQRKDGSNDTLGYGLLLPTAEQLSKIPKVASAGFEENLIKPVKSDIKSLMPPVGYQGTQNSCVGWALAYALTSYKIKAFKHWSYEHEGQIDDDRLYSPTYLFTQAKRALNDRNCSNGLAFAFAFDILKEDGLSTLKYAPYTEKRCFDEPTPLAKENAKTIKFINAQLLLPNTDTAKIKYNIFVGNPILIGLNVDASFQDDGRTSFENHQYYQYIPKGRFIDYHAVVCVGYDDEKKVFTMMNSYGSNWGNNGFFDIPYHLFSTLVTEAYLINYKMTAGSFIAAAKKNLNPEKTETGDSTLLSWLKPGYYRDFKNIRIGLVGYSKLGPDTTATLSFVNLDNDSLISIVKVKQGDSYYFDVGDQKVSVVFDRLDRAGKTKKPATFFSLNIAESPTLEFKALIDKIGLLTKELDLNK